MRLKKYSSENVPDWKLRQIRSPMCPEPSLQHPGRDVEEFSFDDAISNDLLSDSEIEKINSDVQEVPQVINKKGFEDVLSDIRKFKSMTPKAGNQSQTSVFEWHDKIMESTCSKIGGDQIDRQIDRVLSEMKYLENNQIYQLVTFLPIVKLDVG